MAQELSRLAARLEEARSGIAELARSRERVQAQMTALEQQEAKLRQQATVARQFGREDLAHKARTRQQEVQSQRAELAVQLEDTAAYMTIGHPRLPGWTRGA
jgi:phage shock protein A